MFTKTTGARLRTVACATALALGTVSATQAATQTANLSVTASVTANCTISTSPVAFGAYDPVVTNASVDLAQSGTVSVTCTSGASTTVTLGEGANADTGSTPAAPARRMAVGGNFLSYDLFSENTLTNVWGNTAPTGLAHTGTGTTTGLTVFGVIPAGQNVPAGNYVDTVVATITF